ncbi:hypothetical protein JTB14_011225 [Gonioctena quinquepunctata]|nr:hypothetical protein JTB14_011225 [Gonioctena quinquepunctata]
MVLCRKGSTVFSEAVELFKTVEQWSSTRFIPELWKEGFNGVYSGAVELCKEGLNEVYSGAVGCVRRAEQGYSELCVV